MEKSNDTIENAKVFRNKLRVPLGVIFQNSSIFRIEIFRESLKKNYKLIYAPK